MEYIILAVILFGAIGYLIYNFKDSIKKGSCSSCSGNCTSCSIKK